VADIDGWGEDERWHSETLAALHNLRMTTAHVTDEKAYKTPADFRIDWLKEE
jgi:hypothetical protein